MADNVRCRYKTKQGTQCSRYALAGYSGCFNHEPAFELARRANAQKAGQRGGRGRPSRGVSATPGAKDLLRLQQRFEQLADDVLDGTVDKANAAVAIQALNGARSCVLGAAKLRELFEVEQRLDALEGHLGGTA
jgi:hypothetical protein